MADIKYKLALVEGGGAPIVVPVEQRRVGVAAEGGRRARAHPR